MSTYYYLYDPKEESVSPILHARQAWGSWTSEDDEELHKWIVKHRDNKPFIVDENFCYDKFDDDK